MVSRTLYDSTDVADIPHHAMMVAGYVNGKFVTWPALIARFPDATRVSITVTMQHRSLADAIDRETGDVTANEAAAWACDKHHAGGAPAIYVNRASWADAIAAVKAAGLNPRRVFWWIADWTGNPHRPRLGLLRAGACQYADPASSGGHYDLTVVYGRWPGVDPVPLSRRHRRRARQLIKAWDVGGRRSPVPAGDEDLLQTLEVAAARVVALSPHQR